jgi:hypothetical protein
MPEELSKALIMQGKNATRVLPVQGYDAEVTIRSLTDLELADVIGIAKKNDWLSIFDMVSKTKAKDGNMGDISVISGAIPLMIEICCRGAVMYDRKDPDNPKELTKEEKKPIFQSIGRFASVTIGVEILMDTLGPLDKIEGFMKPLKPNSSKS